MGGVAKKVKKVVKKVTKVVKKVVKGVGKVAKKVWKGVKKVAKGIGKAVKKMGPLASIAIGFIPGFQALWANAGIWGAMGKGAITGFITSGGKLKGALTGGLLGGAGYAVAQGASSFKGGWESMGESASISDKLSAGFKAVGNSTVEGVSNMYNSASNLAGGGDLNYLKADPITGEMTSIYGKSEASTFARMDGESVLHRANKEYVNSLDPKAQKFIADNSEAFKDITPKQMNEIFEHQTGGEYSSGTWGQTDALEGYTSSVAAEKKMAELGGYTYDKFDDTYLTPSAKEYQSALDARGLDARGIIAETLDQPLKPNMMDVNYEGPLTYTEMGEGDKAFFKSKRTVAPRTGKPDAGSLADAAKSLFAPGQSSSVASLPFSTGDTGDQYGVSGGLTAVGGEAGTGLGFAEYYGGALDPRQYVEQQSRRFKSLLG